MKNLFKSKKIQSFLIMIVLFVSLFFFSACDELDDVDEEGNKISSSIIKIIYKPYASSKPNLLSTKTYGEIIYDGLIEQSEDFLTRAVASYGLGEIEVKNKNGSKVDVSPNIETDFQTLLACSSLNKTQKTELAQDVSKFTHVYFHSSNKVMILANTAPKANILSSMLTITDADGTITYTANSSLKNLTKNTNVSSSATLDSNCVYKYSTGSNIAFLFVGGHIGSNSSLNSFSNSSNALNYIKSFFNSDYNNIQKSFAGVVGGSLSSNGEDKNLSFNSWKYSLTESEYNSVSNNVKNYLEKYLDKFSLSFATELAKIILLRVEGTTMPQDLANLYTSALNEINSSIAGTTSSTTNREAFLTASCEYIDHLGYLKEEKLSILNYILNTVIGPNIVTQSDLSKVDLAKAVEDDLETLTGTNLNKFILKTWALSNEVYEKYPQNPILEYKTIRKSYVEDVDIEINGYIQSIVVMDKKSLEITDAIFTFEEKEEPKSNNEISFICAYISYIDGQFNDDPYGDSPVVTDETKTINFEFPLPQNKPLKVDNCDDNLKGNDTINSDTGSLFVHSENLYKDASTPIEEGFAWFFHDAMNDYVQIVFAGKDIFSLNEINLNTFGAGAYL